MPFEKGHAGGPGRPKGSVGMKKRFKRSLEEICKGWHPVDELLKLLPQLDIKDRKDVLVQLLPYFEPRKKEVTYSVTQSMFGHTNLNELSNDELCRQLLPLALKAKGIDPEELGDIPSQVN